MSEKKYLDYNGLAEVVDKSKQSFQKKEFLGTKEEWEALPSADKVKYSIVNLTDDTDPAYTVVDVVENNNMHAVTSNAVYGQVYHKMGGIASSSITDVNVFTTFEDYAQANRWVFGNFPFSGTCTNLPGGAAAMNTYCWMYKSSGGTMKVRLMDCYTHNEWVTQKVGGVWSAWDKMIRESDLTDLGREYRERISRPAGGWTIPESGKESAVFSIACPKGRYFYQIYMEGDGSSTRPSNGEIYAYGHCNSAQAGGGWQGVRFPMSVVNKSSDANWQETLIWSAWNPAHVSISLFMINPL